MVHGVHPHFLAAQASEVSVMSRLQNIHQVYQLLSSNLSKIKNDTKTKNRENKLWLGSVWFGLIFVPSA
jgi:hypothetical protein